MIIQKYTCDQCGKEIEQPTLAIEIKPIIPISIEVGMAIKKNDGMWYNSVGNRLHFCCITHLKKYFEGKPSQP